MACSLKVNHLSTEFTGLSGERKGKMVGKRERNFQLICGSSQNGILGRNILERK